MFPAVDKAVADGKKIGSGVLTRLDSLIHEISQIRKEAPLWATQDVVSLPFQLSFTPTLDAVYQQAFTVPLGEVWEMESSVFPGIEWRLAADVPEGLSGNTPNLVWLESNSANRSRTYYPRVRLYPGVYFIYTDTANGRPVRLQFRKVLPNPVPRQAVSGSDNSGRIMLPDIQHEEYRDSVAVPSDLPQQQ